MVVQMIFFTSSVQAQLRFEFEWQAQCEREQGERAEQVE